MKKIISVLLAAVMMTSLLAGCGSKEVDVDVKALVEEITTSVELPMGAMADDDTASQIFYLNLEEDVEQYGIYFTMINVSSANIAVVKAKEGKAENVKESLEKRKADMERSFEQYLPDQYEAAKNATVEVRGNYVIMVMLSEGKEDVQKIIDEAIPQ